MVPAVPAGTQGSQQTKRPVLPRTMLAPSLRNKKRKHGVSCEPAASHTRSRMPSDSSPDLTPPMPFLGLVRTPALDSAMKMICQRTTWIGHAQLRCTAAVHWLLVEPPHTCDGRGAPNLVFLANDDVGINLLFFLPVKLRQSVSSKLLRELANMGTY